MNAEIQMFRASIPCGPTWPAWAGFYVDLVSLGGSGASLLMRTADLNEALAFARAEADRLGIGLKIDVTELVPAAPTAEGE